MSYDSALTFFRLLPERDHLFSFSDFVDFATGDAPADPYTAAYRLEEQTIYSYNSYDDPHDLSFSSQADEFAVGGVSMVRHGDEVSLILVGGRIADLSAATDNLLPDYGVPGPGKEAIAPDPRLTREAVPLLGHRDIWKTLALARVDLRNRTEQVRYVLTDCGNMYEVATDDPAVFAGQESSELVERWQNSHSKRLVAHQALFEIAKTATLLPAYFEAKLTLVREDSVTTPYSRMLDEPGTRAAARVVPPKDRVLYRRVAALRVINPAGTRIARRFSPPQYRVEVEGFWRLLNPTAKGRGPSGEEVLGRTWVRGHARWRSRPAKPIEVLVKSRLSIAKAVIAAEQRIQGIPQPELVKAAAAADSAATGHHSTPFAAPTPVAPSMVAADIDVSREDAYRERRLLTTRLRWRIFQRDDFRCQRCGADAAADHSVRLDVDHKVPVSKGGKTENANLWTLCSRCNNGKGAAL